MSLQAFIKRVFPKPIEKHLQRKLLRPSRARRESSKRLLNNCNEIQGEVLSIGSDNDSGGEGGFYKSYFRNARSYTTSEIVGAYTCDIRLNVRSMPEIPNESFDCIFCSGVLEHVDDCQSGFSELTRILKIGGILLLGLRLRQAIHMSPHCFWRFTEFGIKHILKELYEIVNLSSIDLHGKTQSPAAYWVNAKKIKRFNHTREN